MDKKGMAAVLVAGLVAGALLGLGAGLLYAPRPGSEARDLIKTKAWESRHKLGEFAQKARDRALAGGNGRKSA
jgi:gas vesicle protein